MIHTKYMGCWPANAPPGRLLGRSEAGGHSALHARPSRSPAKMEVTHGQVQGQWAEVFRTELTVSREHRAWETRWVCSWASS